MDHKSAHNVKQQVGKTGDGSIIVEMFNDEDAVIIYRLFYNGTLHQEIITHDEFHTRIADALLRRAV